jgi:hypothetical protein
MKRTTRKRKTVRDKVYERRIESLNKNHDRLMPYIGNIAMMSAQLDETLSHHVAVAINRGFPVLGLVVIERLSITGKLDLYRRLVRTFHPDDDQINTAFSRMRKLIEDANRQRNRAVHGDWSYDVGNYYQRITESSQQDRMNLKEFEKSVGDHQDAIDAIYKFASLSPVLKSPGPIPDNVLGVGLTGA